MRSLTINLTLTLFSLLTPTIHAQNFTTFHDYLTTYIPKCIIDCTISAAERDTECGSGSVSSTDADEIGCLCDAFWYTNGRFVRDFSESMARCVTDARCSLDELEDGARVDPWTLFDGVDGLCGGSRGHDHDDDDDSNNSNDDTSNSNNSNNSSSSSNSDDTQDWSSDTADDTSDSSTSSSSNSGDDDNGAASIASLSIAALAAGALVVLAAF